MRIKTQFVITMLLFGTVLVIMAISAVYTSKSLDRASQQERLSDSIAQGASELSYLTNEYLIYGESRQLEHWKSRFASLSEAVVNLDVDIPQQQALARNIQKNQIRLKEVFDSVVSASRRVSQSKSAGGDLPFLQVSWSRMAVQGQELVSDATRLSQMLRQQMDRLMAAKSVLIYAIMALFGGLLLASYLLTYRRIIKAIIGLQEGARIIGTGNLEVSIQEGKNDEIGELSRAFNKMTAELKTVTASKADLEQEMRERRRAEEALRESERRWAVTLGSIGDAVIATDTAGRVSFLNRVAEELTGWSKDDAAGELVTEVFNIVNEHTRVTVEDPVSKVLQTGLIVGLANHTVLLRKDGGEVPIDDSGAPIRDGEGRVLGVVLVFRDITKAKAAEKAQRQLNETLEQRVAERTAVAEARAKQLQTLAIELIESEERERRRVADLLHDDLQQILASARMQLQAACQILPPEPILTTVEQLLEQSIGKSRSLSHELSPAILHHSGLVAALQWLSQQMRNRFGLEVQLELNGAQQFEHAPVRVFLFRAVQELLFNVVKHAGVKSARVALAGSDISLAITVSDQGLGLDPNILSSPTLTTGFGLLRLRERARYIGGSLMVESAPGRGSRFTLTVPLDLPRADETEPAADRPSVSQARSSVFRDGDAIRVLFADDHRVMRNGLIKLMEGQTNIHVVGQASNGREAVELARQLKPHVVVMDVSMPEMDGIEATRRIKSDLPEVRVIGLSMHEDEHIVRSMGDAGAEAFVSKTAPTAELFKAIYGVAHQKKDIIQEIEIRESGHTADGREPAGAHGSDV
jgi:PAS domain S-box-containing protein